MNTIRQILEWNKKLFSFFVLIFLLFVLLNSLKFDYIIEHPKLFNLNYKLIFVIVSGVLVLVEHYLKKKQQKLQKEAEGLRIRKMHI